jgi:hypothetical protein
MPRLDTCYCIRSIASAEFIVGERDTFWQQRLIISFMPDLNQEVSAVRARNGRW